MKTKAFNGKIAAMEKGGKVLGAILAELLDFSQPGISLLEIESLAQKRIQEAGMKPSFSTVGNYQWATCLCVNDVIVHGIPTPYVLKQGDLFTVDIGLIHDEYHTDTAWTKVVHGSPFVVDSNIQRFLDVGEKTLKKAVAQARAGNRVGHISKAIQKAVEGAGYGIVKTLVGHGVGKTLHEPPQIPGFVKGAIEKTPLLTAGMTIAIEVIYTMGKPLISYHDDGWSIGTRDHSLSAVFEQTIAVTEAGPLIVTPAPVVR